MYNSVFYLVAIVTLFIVYNTQEVKDNPCCLFTGIDMIWMRIQQGCTILDAVVCSVAYLMLVFLHMLYCKSNNSYTPDYYVYQVWFGTGCRVVVYSVSLFVGMQVCSSSLGDIPGEENGRRIGISEDTRAVLMYELYVAVSYTCLYMLAVRHIVHIVFHVMHRHEKEEPESESVVVCI